MKNKIILAFVSFLFVWSITVSCSWGSGGGGGKPHPTQTATYPFTLNSQPVYEGPIPYAGSFGKGITGNLKQITNPNTFRVGLVLPGQSTAECFSKSGAVIVLGSNASTTAQNLTSLFGNSNPSLPIQVAACIEAGAVTLTSIQISITYTYTS